MQLILQNGQPGRGFRGSQRGVCSRRWNRLTPRDVCEELASRPLFLPWTPVESNPTRPRRQRWREQFGRGGRHLRTL